jgi:general secretion pathway protein J
MANCCGSIWFASSAKATKMTPTQSHIAGFTLVEALAAILLMGIILAGLGTVTAQWLPSWNRSLRQLQRDRLLATEFDRLTDDLAAAQFISVGFGDSPPLFDGDDASVTFVRTTLAVGAEAGLQVVRIREIKSKNGPELVRNTAPLPMGKGQAGGVDAFNFADPVVVIHSPYRVSFSYAGPDRLWRDTWQNQRALPRAIRVQARDGTTSALLAATTSTLVHAELPASCTWTGIGANCLTIDNRP